MSAIQQLATVQALVTNTQPAFDAVLCDKSITFQREADRAHKAKINGAALAAFIAGGMTQECAKLAVTLIAKGEIPAVQINY